VAARYDIHGNLPALEAVLGEMAGEGIAEIVIGGDVVPGPMWSGILRRLSELDVSAHCIRGNGEREVLGVREGREPRGLPEAAAEVLRWVARGLSDGEAETLRSWPPTREMDVEGVGRVLFCHGTPRSDTEIFTRLTPGAVLAPLFEGLEVDLVVCGHTHMQFDREVASVRVVNAGSVGMPFGDPGAYWLKLGPGVELRRTDYDLEAAAARIRRTSYPQADEFAVRQVLRPPGESEMLEMFGGAFDPEE
jgi:predicted phosphodiesterase